MTTTTAVGKRCVRYALADEEGGTCVHALPRNGRVRPITRWGEPVLHQPCRIVENFDGGLAELVADMAATMAAAEGVGLAAPQIGVDLAVFVFCCPDAEGAERSGVVCNPRLSVPSCSELSDRDEEEGCLSLPGAYARLQRPDPAIVEGVDHTGTQIRVRGTGLLARCLHHETDHLRGIVFGDLLKRRARKRLYKDADAAREHYGPGWPQPTPESK